MWGWSAKSESVFTAGESSNFMNMHYLMVVTVMSEENGRDFVETQKNEREEDAYISYYVLINSVFYIKDAPTLTGSLFSDLFACNLCFLLISFTICLPCSITGDSNNTELSLSFFLDVFFHYFCEFSPLFL